MGHSGLRLLYTHRGSPKTNCHLDLMSQGFKVKLVQVGGSG